MDRKLFYDTQRLWLDCIVLLIRDKKEGQRLLCPSKLYERGTKMTSFKDCFTRDEWIKLMEAKEVAAGHPVQLTVQRRLSGGLAHYWLSLGEIALIGKGFYVSDHLWSETELLIKSHFNIEG